MALSLVLEAFKRQQRGQSSLGASPRMSARTPSAPGFARGSLGLYGSRQFKSRDPDKGIKKELAMLRSPVFQQYIQSLGRSLVR